MSSALRQPRSGAVMLEGSLQREIRVALDAAGVEQCAAFVLVEFGDTGLRASVVDASTGASLVERGNGRLCPHTLDVALADHLVRMGRVTRPDSSDWAAELVGLMPRIRERLAVADGAFAMGTQDVAMFRMSRNDCVTALSAELADAATVITRTIEESPVTVDAVVAMPDHEIWPGLVRELADGLAVSVVALDATDDAVDESDDRGLHTDPDVPITTAITAIAEVADGEAAPVDTWSDAAEDVTEPISVVRTAEPPDDGVERVGAGLPTATSPSAVAAVRTDPVRSGPVGDASRGWAGGVSVTGDHDVVRGDRSAVEALVSGPGPRTYTPPGDSTGGAGGLGSRRRLAIGAVAVGGAVVLGGAILAVPWVHAADDARPAASVVGFRSPASPVDTSAPAATGPVTPAPTQAPSPTTPARTTPAPIDARAAGVPAVQYTAPPAPPQTRSYVAPAQPARPAPRPALPRRRTIPNPIPGLPPIVLP